MKDEDKNRDDLLRDIEEQKNRIRELEETILLFRNAGEAFLQSEEKTKLIFDATNNMIIAVDAKDVILECNQKARRMLGYEQEDLLGRKMAELFFPESRGEWAKGLIEAFKKGYSGEKEYIMLRADGSEVYVSVDIAVLKDHEGKYVKAMCMVVDITERKMSENRIKKEREFIKKIADSMPVYMAYLDSDGRYAFANREYLALLGVEYEDIFGKSYKEVLPVNMLKVIMPRVEEAMEGNKVAYEDRFTLNGKELYFMVRYVPDMRENGEVKGLFVLVDDVTVRRKTEEALKISEANYRSIFEAVNDAIVIHDIDTGQILDVNESMERLVGYTKSEFRSITIEDISSGVSPYDQVHAVELVRKAAEGGPALFEWECKRKDGEVIRVEVNLKSTVLEGKRKVVAVIRDITARIEATRKIEESKKALESIFSASASGIGMAKNRVIEWVNRQVEDMTGYSKEELVGHSARLLYPNEEEFNRVGDVKYGQIKEKGRGSLETKWKKKDGVIIDVFLSSSPIDPEDMSRGVTFTVLDITDKKTARMERDLFFNNSVDILVIADVDGYFKQVNPALTRVLGWTKKEILSRPWIEFVHPEDRQKTEEAFEALRSDGVLKDFENRYISGNGDMKVLSWNAVMLSGSRVIFAVARDVTRNKIDERKMIEAEDKFRQIFESETSAILVFDSETLQFVEVNSAAEKIYGYSREEFMSLKVTDISTEEEKTLESIDLTVYGQLKELIPIRYHRKKDGTVFPVEISPGTFESNGKKYCTGICRDITKREEAKLELEQSRSRYQEAYEEWQKTFDSISDFALVMDMEHRIVKVNRAFLELTGLSRDEVIGRRCYDIVHKSGEPWKDCPFEMSLKDDKPHTRKVVDPNLGVPLLVTTSPIKDDSGVSIGIVHIAKDISEMIFSEQAIAKKMHELEVFHRVSVDREMMMVDLKKKIKEMEKEKNGE